MLLKCICFVWLLGVVKNKELSCFTCSDVVTNGTLVEGPKVWRDDLRCGVSYNLSDGSAAQCNPDDTQSRTCCSQDGYCGASTLHCCPGCADYTRSNKDNDLAVCSGAWDFAKTDCGPTHKACSRVRISTNKVVSRQTVNETDTETTRYQIIRRCHEPTEEPLCTKYNLAGHYCDESLCWKNNCNAATRTFAQIVSLSFMLIILNY